jgi:protein Tex
LRERAQGDKELLRQVEKCETLDELDVIAKSLRKTRETLADSAAAQVGEHAVSAFLAAMRDEPEASAPGEVAKFQSLPSKLHGFLAVAAAAEVAHTPSLRSALKEKIPWKAAVKISPLAAAAGKGGKERGIAPKAASLEVFEGRLIGTLKPHQVLALFRAEARKEVRLSVTVPHNWIAYVTHTHFPCSRLSGWPKKIASQAIADAVDKYLAPALIRDARSASVKRAKERAVQSFGENLSRILMARPLAGHTVLGIDPGFKVFLLPKKKT